MYVMCNRKVNVLIGKHEMHHNSESSYKLVIIREHANTIRHRSEIAVEVWHVLHRSSLARTGDLSRFIPAREPRMHVSRIEYRVAHQVGE